jgi:hypothetical protein
MTDIKTKGFFGNTTIETRTLFEKLKEYEEK